MDGLTLRQYAKERGISSQAASQLFRRHKDNMQDMFTETKNAITLNEKGVEYLDRVRDKNPASAVSQNIISDLRARIEALEKMIEENHEVIRQQREDLRAREDAIRQLREDFKTQEEDIRQQREDLQKREENIRRLQEDLQAREEDIRKLREDLQTQEEDIRRLQETIIQKDQIIMMKDQIMIKKDEQVFLLTTTKPKKGLFQRLKDRFRGTDDENGDGVIDAD